MKSGSLGDSTSTWGLFFGWFDLHLGALFWSFLLRVHFQSFTFWLIFASNSGFNQWINPHSHGKYSTSSRFSNFLTRLLLQRGIRRSWNISNFWNLFFKVHDKIWFLDPNFLKSYSFYDSNNKIYCFIQYFPINSNIWDFGSKFYSGMLKFRGLSSWNRAKGSTSVGSNLVQHWEWSWSVGSVGGWQGNTP